MGRRPVVRARREWAVSVGSTGVDIDDTNPLSVFLLVGDQEEREELGIEPKIVRIHGNMFIKPGPVVQRVDDDVPQKYFWGIAIGRRDGVQDFIDTGDPDGICEPFGDASDSDFMMWGVEVIDPAMGRVWNTATPEVILETSPTCCYARQVKVDVRAQRRLEKEDCIYWVIQYVTGTEGRVHRIDFDARILVAQ